jgi:hypothetical protein
MDGSNLLFLERVPDTLAEGNIKVKGNGLARSYLDIRIFL